MSNLWKAIKNLVSKFLRVLYNLILNRVLAGVVVIVPLGVTYYVVMFVYSLLIVRVSPLGSKLFVDVPQYFAPIATIFLIMIGILLLGFFTRLVVGRRIVSLVETILEKIPVIKTIYNAVKKILEVFLRTSTEVGETQKFAVIIDFPFPGVKSVGIVTNKVEIEGIGKCYTLFVPTVPNPTSGYFEIVPVNKISAELSVSTEEIVSMLLSGGVVTPDSMRVDESTTLPRETTNKN